MKVETTTDEATILIAVLTFAEGAALAINPPMSAAIADLRPWRSALLRTYLAARLTEPAERELTADEAAQALTTFVAGKGGVA